MVVSVEEKSIVKNGQVTIKETNKPEALLKRRKSEI
jgi:hypothetical protein